MEKHISGEIEDEHENKFEDTHSWNLDGSSGPALGAEHHPGVDADSDPDQDGDEAWDNGEDTTPVCSRKRGAGHDRVALPKKNARLSRENSVQIEHALGDIWTLLTHALIANLLILYILSCVFLVSEAVEAVSEILDQVLKVQSRIATNMKKVTALPNSNTEKMEAVSELLDQVLKVQSRIATNMKKVTALPNSNTEKSKCLRCIGGLQGPAHAS